MDEQRHTQEYVADEGVQITPYLPYAQLQTADHEDGDHKLDESTHAGKRWVLGTAWVSLALSLLNPALTYAVYLAGSLIGGSFFRYNCGLRTTVTALPIIALVAMFLAVISASRCSDTNHKRMVVALSATAFILGIFWLLGTAYISPLQLLFRTKPDC